MGNSATRQMSQINYIFMKMEKVKGETVIRMSMVRKM